MDIEISSAFNERSILIDILKYNIKFISISSNRESNYHHSNSQLIMCRIYAEISMKVASKVDSQLTKPARIMTTL